MWRELRENGGSAMVEHDWRLILQRAEGASTDTIEQCSKCNVVRHVYLFATLARQLGETRHFEHGQIVAAREQCGPALPTTPELHDELPP